MNADLLRLKEWPIVSFSFFTLGAFAANDFGRGFVNTIGLTFLVVAAIWTVASTVRRGSAKTGAHGAAA
ncbi:MAG TPA: hypothetical protein VMV15_07845 [Candidatus Binataceae bacterium]|nr:hypothetical protein [Candidatus Binataceae bacterium]